MKVRAFFILNPIIVLMAACMPEDTGVESADQYIQLQSIMPMVRTSPFPSSGKVNINSPHFMWSPVYSKKTGANSYEWDDGFQYRVRISKDREFKDATTISSEVQDWTFFNPHKKLEKGVWYWQYAEVDRQKGQERWSEAIKFEIDGNEREFVTPDPDVFTQRIPMSHPRFLATKDEIGKLNFPEEKKSSFLINMDRKIGEKFPETLIYNDGKVLDRKKKELNDKNYHRYVDKATKEKYRPHVQQAIYFIKAFLITGDQKYEKEVLRRYFYLKEQYNDINKAGLTNDFTKGYYYSLVTNVFDVFYENLEEDERRYMLDILVENQNETYHHFLYYSVTELMSSHKWQHHIRNFFTTSISLLHHTPEAEKWTKYIYDLWTIRAPTGSLDDGAWVAGNGYMGANIESLFVMPFLLSKYSGVDYFEDPWYKNVPAYLFLTSPVGHIAGGFGDNADTKITPTISLVGALNDVKNNGYSQAYIELDEKFGTGYLKSRQTIDKGGNIYWFQNQSLNFDKGEIDSQPLQRARVFRDAGIAAMHTNIREPDENLMLSFRSSPFGVSGHAHACQNTFNIQYGGEPLFFRSGYYSSGLDHHSLQSYRHTRAHNGILVDGIGTSMFADGYGWIPRFIDSENISYVMGDASNAYDGTMARDEHREKGEFWKVDFTPENGFGKPGVKKFRRHVTLLRPDIIVIYDELEAAKPVTWSWLIHSKDTLAQHQDNSLYTENQKGKGLLNLFSSSPLKPTVTDQFYAPAVDWLGNGEKKGMKYTNHWHGKMDSKKSEKVRFLAVIQVVDKSSYSNFHPIARSGNGRYKVGDWTISAQLDPDQPSEFKIVNERELCGISMGREKLVINGLKYKHSKRGSTVIVDGKESGFEEAFDELPSAAIYR
ncbi:MAG: DUF4962 domain-containing protein [Cyclobacteriaceae bacterium]